MRETLVFELPVKRSGWHNLPLKTCLHGMAAGALLALMPMDMTSADWLSSASAQSEQELTQPDSKPPGVRNDARAVKKDVKKDTKKDVDDNGQPEDVSAVVDPLPAIDVPPEPAGMDEKPVKNAAKDKQPVEGDDAGPADDDAAAKDPPAEDDAAAKDPPPDDEATGQVDDQAAQAPQQTEVVDPLQPGEAVVTRFSHTTDGTDADGKPIKVIDLTGISASIIDIRNPSEPPIGQHWLDEPQRMFVTASDVGQVFGVAIAQREGETGPTIFLSATAAYGLHRMGKDWMEGMWGAGGGPGTIYRLSAANGYKPEKFADITLDGRENSGAALGNIAYDKVHDRLFVSDLETGMIHVLDAATGKDLGTYDHGADGRVGFLDVWSQQQLTLDPVSFDPASSADIEGCGDGFTSNPACWNLADFRRRVWGLKVRTDEAGNTRLFYSVWGSDAFGNPDWAKAGDDRRNSVWSVAITADGAVDTTTIRREFFMQAFWPSEPGFGNKAGNSNPVSDISFPECTPQNTMLVAERGGMRNLGLETPEAFARPYESRVLRYEVGQDEIWRPKGRYDVGFHDRASNEGDPAIFANAAGGVDFSYKMDENGLPDTTKPSQSVWMTGDGLCSPLGPCNDKVKGEGSDKSEVHGLQGSPFDGIVPLDTMVQASADLGALFRSYMIDTDINTDEDGKPVAEELERNDATKIGDVAIYQVCQAAEPLPAMDVPPEGDGYVEIADPPAEDYPVHTLRMSHNKWASTSHRVRSSWHYRNGSWHDSRRSWHWRDGSWHQQKRSWHRRHGSWHDRERSWHYKSRSFHSKRQTWSDDHWKGRSYHNKRRSWDNDHRKGRSYHVKRRSWDDDHRKGRSYHFKGRTWGDDDHRKGRSYHFKGRTWGDGDHRKGRSYHNKRLSWDDNKPDHRKGRSYHVKKRTWGGDDGPVHLKRKSMHVKGRSYGKPEHSRRRSMMNDDKPKHLRSRSRHDQDVNVHTKRESRAAHDDKPRHTRSRSRADQDVDVHSRRESRAKQQHDDQPRHSKRESRGTQEHINQHSRRESRGTQEHINQHSKRESRGVQHQDNQNNEQQHGRRRSMMQGGE
ncbi:hypothetical protein IHQ71_13580 [Rhizobium sp. TH2]|uniref:hypothetical protein n=1 Tax=Rhizobium sp. TH2 TaxID=2775403 RepID=UPI002157A42D|nr:hypothetical protein [Rhizobium sp. TH2]UVC11512.1 hypothetical protein IHQ71_13580 [Rhizobium sp. TH2]